MKNIFLIARRDYLTYVMAWGFWLGLLSTPLLLAFFAILPTLITQTDGSKYYTILDESGTFSESFHKYRKSAETERIERVLALTSPDAYVRFRSLKEAGKTNAEALAQTGVPGLSMVNFQSKFVYIDPPGKTVAEMAPWLRGQKQVNGPDGPKPLHALIVYKGQSERIEFWSESVSRSALVNSVLEISKRHTEGLEMTRLGLAENHMAKVDKTAPSVKVKRLTRPQPNGVVQGREKTQADSAPQYAASAIAFMLWFIILSVVNYLLMGTIEERSNKIFDTLLTSVKLDELLAGKLLGVLAVTLTLSIVWAILGVAAWGGINSMTAGVGSSQMLMVLQEMVKPEFVILAILCFICGYILYGSFFLALGSLCDSVHEAQTLMSPMLIFMMVPLLILIVALQDLEMAIVGYASWVPFFTPFLLLLRLPIDPNPWVIVLQAVMMICVSLLVLWVATKVYRAGAVTGASMGDIWRRMTKGA